MILASDQNSNGSLASINKSSLLEGQSSLAPPRVTSSVQVPQTVVEQKAQSGLTDTPQSKKKQHLPIVIFLIIFLFIFIFGGLVTAVAYGKISLGKPSFERKIEKIVLSLPFMPKTPKYILESAALAHQKISKHSFDISLAINSDSSIPFYGLDQLDVLVNGKVDYSDSENIITSFNASLGNDANVTVRKKSTLFYIKINKIPAFLSFFLPIDEKLTSVLENWVTYDTRALTTTARNHLEEKSPNKSTTQELIEEIIQNTLDDKILDVISLSQEKLDGASVYKLRLTATDELVDYLGNKVKKQSRDKLNTFNNQQGETKEEFKLSEVVRNLEVEIWIDEKDHYLRKSITFFNFDTKESSAYYPSGLIPEVAPIEGEQKISVSIASQFSNFGDQVIVETPTQSITFEELFKLIGEIYQESPQVLVSE